MTRRWCRRCSGCRASCVRAARVACFAGSYVTQSGFSRRIPSLEQWIGAELSEHSSFPPVLTPAGRLFRETAEDVLSRLFDTRAIIRTEQRIAGKSLLQIAAGHTIAPSFLPTWLKALAPHVGEVRARVIPTNVHDSTLMLVTSRAAISDGARTASSSAATTANRCA